MIHARLDAESTKNITGFECGTRAEFDERHGGDPLWVFLDFDVVQYRVRKADFLLNPLLFLIDERGMVQRRLPARL